MADRPLINGRIASWADLKVRVQGSGVTEDLVDISGVKYEQKVTHTQPKGRGMGSRGKTTGEYECSGSVSLFLAASVALLQKLQDSTTSGRVSDADFDVLGQFEWEDAPGTILSFELIGCSISSDGFDAKPGTENVAVEHDLQPIRVKTNGICLIGDE